MSWTKEWKHSASPNINFQKKAVTSLEQLPHCQVIANTIGFVFISITMLISQLELQQMMKRPLLPTLNKCLMACQHGLNTVVHTHLSLFLLVILNGSKIISSLLLKKIQEEEQSSTEDGSQPELVDNAKIVMWSDFNPDTDSYAKAQEDNEMAGKLFLSFDYRSMFWDEDKSEIAVASPIDGYNEQNDYTT